MVIYHLDFITHSLKVYIDAEEEVVGDSKRITVSIANGMVNLLAGAFTASSLT